MFIDRPNATPQDLRSPFWSPCRFLFVEFMLLLVFLDDGLIGFLKVLCQDNVAVLPYSQHPSLKRQREKKHGVKV